MLSKKRIGFITIALIALLVFASVAYAAHTTISTNNRADDVNWDTISVIITDGADTVANYDIVKAWVGNSADRSTFYFRVALAGTGRLPNDYSALEARLDCNQDGEFADAEDVVVYYALDTFLPSGEEVIECQGTDYIDCDYAPEPNNSDTNPATFGQEIAGPPYTYEWQADVDDGATNWSDCLETFNVQFASVDNTGAVRDITMWKAHSDPNSVTLTGIVAQSPILLAAVIVLGAAVLGGLFLIRRRSKAG
jgi:hypothetical protein